VLASEVCSVTGPLYGRPPGPPLVAGDGCARWSPVFDPDDPIAVPEATVEPADDLVHLQRSTA
jgi:hypothetical protein